MAFEKYKAGNPGSNATIQQAQAMMASLANLGKTGVLFANPVSASAPGSDMMLPFSQSQDDGNAPWVDQSNDFSTITDLASGITMAQSTDPLYLQIWVDKLGNYYCVGSVLGLMQLNPSVTLDQAVS